MTRRLGGTKKSLAAIASLSLAATLACVGATTGCGSSTSNTSPADSGPDGTGLNNFDGGEDSPFLPDTFVAPPPDVGVPETAPALTTLPAPTFTPAAGALNGPTNVAISDMGLPASGFIYYTTNGTNPNPNSLVYSGPIQVSTGETIRAYASAPGLFNDSPIAAAVYTITAPPPPDGGNNEGGTTLSEPVFSPGSSVQNNDFKIAVATSNGATVCYTLDGVTTPTCNAGGACTGSSLQYNSVTQIAINGTVSSGTGGVDVKAITCAAGATTSPVADQTYTLKVADPLFSNPAPGTVLLGATPIVQSPTTGATISYTTGSAGAPTCINGTAGVGTAVSDPHTFASATGDALRGSTTYQTIGCKQGYAPSNVSTSAFTVQLNALTFPPAGTAGAPGTYDKNVAAFTFGDLANSAILGQDWGCYSLGATAPTCGATAGTCGAGITATAAGLNTANPVITKTGVTLTVIDCAVGYTASAPQTGAYTLQLDAPDLNLPGTKAEDPNPADPSTCVGAVAAQIPSFNIPANLTGMVNPKIEQDGPGGAQAYGFVCALKGGTPQCGNGACTTGSQLGSGGTFTQCASTVSLLPGGSSVAVGDTWTLVACPAQGVNFLASTPTQVSFNGPGTASAPLIAPGSGNSTEPVAPTITNTDTTASGSTICFTEDGTTPTCAAGACGGAGTFFTQHLDPAGGATVPTSGGISLTNPGSGYTTAPAVDLTGGGATTQATATATLTITGYTITNGGTGYSASDGDFTCIPVNDQTGGGNGTAFVDAILTGGSISSLVFDGTCGGGTTHDGHGSAYVTPVITLPTPGTSGTTATATVTGSIDAITVTNNGAGYSTPPTVAISGGGGTAATAIAVTTNTLKVGATLAACGGACPGTALQTNTVGTITATACNATEVAPTTPVSNVYTFTLAQPDFTSPGGGTGNLNTASTISAGQTIVISTASTFSGEVIDVSYGSTAPNCGTGVHQPAANIDGLPATTANGSAVASAGGSVVTVTVPTGVKAFTVNAIACGSATTLQNTSAPRSVGFETVTTATPTLTTDQVVAVAGVAGCAAAPCAPVSPWFNKFDVTLSDTTTGAAICYATSGGVTPSCTAGGACNAGLTYSAAFQIAVSGTPVTAWACAATTGASAPVSTSFDLNLSPVVAFPTTATCGGGITLQFSAGAPGSQVSDSVASQGGATDGAVICFTTDGNPPGNTTTGDTTCTAANGSIVDPTSTTATGTITTTFTLTYQAFLNGFQSTAVSQSVSSAPFLHTGAITLDGVLTDWNQNVEPGGVAGLTTGLGEGNNELNGKEGLFTYNATTLYFAYDDLFSQGTNDATVIFVGNGAANGATQAPATLGSTFIPQIGGPNLWATAGIQYAISWVIGSNSPPAVQQWIQGTGWTPVSIAVAAGYSATNNNVEFSVPIASLPAITTPGTITVVEAEVSGAGAAFPGSEPIDTTIGTGTDFHGFEVNTNSCLAPNAQLF